MTRARRRYCALLVATALAGAALAGAAIAPARAETGTRVVDKCAAPGAGSAMQIGVLLLLDVSRSLLTNDPQNLRISGAKDALLVLDSLSGQFDEAGIRVAVDSFQTNYQRRQDWTDASGAATGLLPRIDEIGAIAAGRTTTDYTSALEGAWNRFAQEPGDCRLLIWFTDGEHVTRAPAEEVQAEEWAELSDMCDSPAMESLSRHVWVGAVRLVADGGSGETLRYLFGETSRDCANPLQGEIYDEFDPADLGRVLHDIIAAPTEDLLYREDPHKLPGEQDIPPAASEYEQCDDGLGTREDPCRIPFRLDESHDSFRAFIDLTFIKQGVRDSGSVKVILQSPPDAAGEHGQSPTIGSLGEIDPAGAGGEYLRIPPFWFYARAQYPSEIQIVGHQAAQQLTDPNRWPWKWDGEWSLLFFGDTPEAQSDARRAAAAVRFQTMDSPATDSFGLDTLGTLSGFVANLPTGETDEADARLRVRVDAGDNEPVYGTRRSLTEEPLPVSGDEARFALDGFLDRLVAWDSEKGGGNGRNLRESVEDRGGVVSVAVLESQLKYGALPDPLVWRRDIGSYALSAAELEDLLARLDGRNHAERLLRYLDDPPTDWLPSTLSLGKPVVSGNTVELTLTVSRSVLGAMLTLDADALEVVNAQDVRPSAAESPLSEAPSDADDGDNPLVETSVADPTGASAAPAVDDRGNFTAAAPELSVAEWTCDVPGTASADESAPSANKEFECPTPLELQVDADRDTELAVAMGLEVAVTEGALDRLWFPPGDDGRARLKELEEAVRSQERTDRIESQRFTIDLAEPPPPPEPVEPVELDDRLRHFWPMLAALVALAVLARVLVAWRLRPWTPLASAEYVVLPLTDDSGLDLGDQRSVYRRELCMGLRRRSTEEVLAGVELRSTWMPLLLGRAPAITASSQFGDCIGDQGCKPRGRRKNPRRCTARIGRDLYRGWVVNDSAGQRHLIVWDLPADGAEAQDRIDYAAGRARTMLEQHQEQHRTNHAGGGAGDTEEGAGSPSGPSSPDGGSDIVAEADAGDPFADDVPEAPRRDPFDRGDLDDPFGGTTRRSM